MESRETRILLAYEHRIVRAGLRSLLEIRSDLRVVGEAADGRAAVEEACRLAPDLVIMDVHLPCLSGVEATRRIVESGCGARVLILTMNPNPARAEDALRAGASGCLVKDSEPDELLPAIEAVRRGNCYLSPVVAQLLVDSLARPKPVMTGINLLTGREREVLLRIADGLATREIARELGVSLKTAETHRCSLMSKLGIRKVAGLVRFAVREGLVTP